MEETSLNLQFSSENEDSEEDEEIWEQVKPDSDAVQVEFLVSKKRKITKEDRKFRKILHKLHLLYLLHSLFLRNSWTQNQSLAEILMESFSISNQSLKELLDIYTLRLTFDDHLEALDGPQDLINSFFKAFINLEPLSREAFVLIFLALLRGMGFEARLISSLNVLPLSFAKHFIPKASAFDLWIEVMINGDWIIIDPLKNFIGSMTVSKHTSYILAFPTSFGFKDITRKYCECWSLTRKLRLKKWWDLVLWYYSKSEDQKSFNDKKEDLELINNEINEKMPTNIQGFLNHPIYCLERHLKKNQFIQPKDYIGVFKKEFVYPRKNIHQLYSKDDWVKRGRLVKDEEPLKISVNNKKESVEHLFAEWQTVDLPRPQLVDGKIPRNPYGNIEIFNDKMYPVNTVHLQDKGYESVVKKLDIDFVKVVNGFEFKGKQAFPKYNGILIHKDSLDAVQRAYQLKIEKDTDTLKQRKQTEIYSKWKRLILGIKLKYRLERDYGSLCK
jgi:hypothetical protein